MSNNQFKTTGLTVVADNRFQNGAAQANFAQAQYAGINEQHQRPQRQAAAMSGYHTTQQLGYFSATSLANGGVTFGYQPPAYNAYNSAAQAQQQACHPRGGFTAGAGYQQYGWR